MKTIIDSHTLERAEERGTNEKEIKDVLETGFSVEAKSGRFGMAKIYPFNRVRGGKSYEQKRVEVIYIKKMDEIVTVTVYVFYGRWENRS